MKKHWSDDPVKYKSYVRFVNIGFIVLITAGCIVFVYGLLKIISNPN
jgi:hypothetical protein